MCTGGCGGQRAAGTDWGILIVVVRWLDNMCFLQKDALCGIIYWSQLVKEGKLAVFKHRGFWKCKDALRDKEALEWLWNY